MKPHYEGGVVVVRIRAGTPPQDKLNILRKARALAAKHSNEYAYYYKKYRG